MKENEEIAYTQGERMAWCLMLKECLKRLGYDSIELKNASWIAEREAAIASLRSLCADFGDNDWDDTLNLRDIIDKHLTRHLHGGKKVS